MTAEWPIAVGAVEANPALMEPTRRFIEATRAAVPGRLADLIDGRFSAEAVAASGGDGLSAGELAVQRLAEQFHLDAHGVTDTQFAAVRSYFADADVIAIMMHLANADGFGKFDRVFAEEVS